MHSVVLENDQRRQSLSKIRPAQHGGHQLGSTNPMLSHARHQDEPRSSRSAPLLFQTTDHQNCLTHRCVAGMEVVAAKTGVATAVEATTDPGAAIAAGAADAVCDVGAFAVAAVAAAGIQQ